MASVYLVHRFINDDVDDKFDRTVFIGTEAGAIAFMDKAPVGHTIVSSYRYQKQRFDQEPDPTPTRCQATNNRGGQCGKRPPKGERFCAVHKYRHYNID